jgi:hypothetical protein
MKEVTAPTALKLVGQLLLFLIRHLHINQGLAEKRAVIAEITKFFYD